MRLCGANTFQGCGDFLFDDRQRIEQGEWISHGRDFVGARIPVHRAKAAGRGIAGEDVHPGIILIEVPELEREMDEAVLLHHRGDLESCGDMLGLDEG